MFSPRRIYWSKYSPIRGLRWTIIPVLRSISQLAGTSDVKGERRVRFAFLSNRACRILTDVVGRADLDAEFERRIAIRAKVVSAACLGDCLAVLQPSYWKIRIY